MVLSETQRLERFENAVFADADRQAKQIADETQEEIAQMIKAAKDNAKMLEEHEIKNFEAAENERMLREISAQKIICQRAVLEHREELITRVFDTVKQRLAQFRASGEYKSCLKKQAEAAKKEYPGMSAAAYVAPEDMKYADALEGFEVRERDSIELGGVFFVFDEKSLVLDMTFDQAFEDQRAEFAKRKELAL